MEKRLKLHRLVCLISLGGIFIVYAMDQKIVFEVKEEVFIIRKKETKKVPQKSNKIDLQAELFWQKTEAYRDGFKSFVESKISMGHKIVNHAPRWVTSVVNTGLWLGGSEYMLDEKELKGLDRYFENQSKKDECLTNVKVNKQLLKEIFDEFAKAEKRKFKHLKPILETKARAHLPGIDEEETRMKLNEDRYFQVLTTTMFATHLYDRGFIA